MDPLQHLPIEIVLRILDFCHISSLANLTRATTSWHQFIDESHQETIYSSNSKTSHPNGSRNLSFLEDTTSFARYFNGTSSFKELCKRQTLLERNWNSREPVTRESILQIGNDAVWRFRADFKRRFFVSTSQQGGLNVTEMDTGNLLWRLSNAEVRPFAHLEYQDGTAVWDRKGNAVEVWKTDLEGLTRGAFRRVAILPHDCITRGFQLSYQTLCVVSTESKAFVYDMVPDEPQLKTLLSIEPEAVGHLDQNEDVVVISMGKQGYHIHEKFSGARLGIIRPKNCTKRFHIDHPAVPANFIVSTGSALSCLPSVDIYPPQQPSKDRLDPIHVSSGPFQNASGIRASLEDDEWGAALLSGSTLVGISRAGRVMVCSDWKLALKDPESFDANSSVIDCEGDDSSFDLGGWLSVRENRIMFEIQDRVYVVALAVDGRIYPSKTPGIRPSFSYSTCSATQLAVPVSFMALFDDCIMSTYTTLGWRRRTNDEVAAANRDQERERFRVFPTKTIRILSLAPDLEANKDHELLSNPAQPRDWNEETHANILEIMDMLSEEEDDMSDDVADNDLHSFLSES